jgi:undecaprenyl-diphosphatase
VSLADVVVLAAVQGAAEVLPISGTGHGALARMWLVPDRDVLAMGGALQLATAAAVALAVRRRLAAAVGGGVRSIARPALLRESADARDGLLIALGTAISLTAAAALRPFVELWAEAPIAVGLGLLITGAALASTAIAPRAGGRAERRGETPGAARDEAPPLLGMAAAGLAHGIGGAPGASRMGAALVVLLWLGVRPGRAVELALMLTAPALLVEGLRAVVPSAGAGEALVAELLVAFVSASLACGALRSLVERRLTGAFALWVIPLGLSTVAYARALPGFAS